MQDPQAISSSAFPSELSIVGGVVFAPVPVAMLGAEAQWRGLAAGLPCSSSVLAKLHGPTRVREARLGRGASSLAGLEHVNLVIQSNPKLAHNGIERSPHQDPREDKYHAQYIV